MPLDMQKLDVFIGRFVADLGATFNAGLVVIGQSLGLYKSLATTPQTSSELAKATGTDDRLEDNLNPVGRVFYGVSTLVCTPASRSQEVGLCLGAQAGEARLRDVVTRGGFSEFRRATETPFNLIFEAKP